MPTSLNGSTWLVLGIDDTTRIIFTGTYKSKTDVYQKIKDVVNLINNSRGVHTVKSVHSDNGEEFLSGGIQKRLTGLGIKHTTSAAYTPEHNGVAERAL
jgi:transposase InsO family protein